jgi:hypothetical protein
VRHRHPYRFVKRPCRSGRFIGRLPLVEHVENPRE